MNNFIFTKIYNVFDEQKKSYNKTLTPICSYAKLPLKQIIVLKNVGPQKGRSLVPFFNFLEKLMLNLKNYLLGCLTRRYSKETWSVIEK